MNEVGNQQYTRMIPYNIKHVTLEGELKNQEYYQRTIKEESPAQKEREERQKERDERRKEIFDEYRKINPSKKNIDTEIASKNMEIVNLKLTNEAEISEKEKLEELKNLEEELKNLELTRNNISKKMKILADELILLKKEEEAEKEAAEKEAAEEEAAEAAAEAAAEEYPRGGKRKSKSKSKKVSKKPVVSQKKQSIYKEILGKQMKIYKMPDSRKEYVKYKGELLHISDYKDLMKQKAIAKTKTKVTKVTQKKAKSKTKK